MDDVTTYALAGAVVVLAIVVAVATRRRRDRSLEPVRLGPSWTPPGSHARGGRTDAAEVLRDDERVERIRDHTGLDDETVATVLIAWDELLSVLGYRSLPADHHYRVYDPYDPPIPSRGADHQPVADPVRVARDVDRRTGVAEIDARSVLDALLEDPAARPGRADRPGDRPDGESAPGDGPAERATTSATDGRAASLTADTPAPERRDPSVDGADPSMADPDAELFGEPTGTVDDGPGAGRSEDQRS